MGRRIALLVALAALVAGYVVQLTGCSLIGAGIGYLVDKDKPTVKELPPGGAFTIESGTRITLQVKDSTSRAGTFQRATREEEAEYVGRYLAWHANVAHGDAPGISDTVEIRSASGTTHGTFTGFGYRSAEVRVADRPVPVSVSFDKIISFADARGDSFSSVRLGNLAATGLLPSRTALVLAVGKSEVATPMDSIATISVPTERHGAMTGFVIGLTVDVSLVIIAAHSASESTPSTGSCQQPSGGYYTSTPGPYNVTWGRPSQQGDSDARW